MTGKSSKHKVPRMVRSHDMSLDTDYADWIREVKQRYHSTQVKAAVKVNSEQLMFNWELGQDLVVRKAEERWGSGIVEQVSLDLQNEFPGAKGFSTRNLWYMKRWCPFYATGDMQKKLHQLGAEMDGNLYGESGVAQTNFAEKLPTTQGKLAQAIIKDTYDLGFVTLPKAYDEHDLEVALKQNIMRFLLELGTGFAFVGRQKEIIVSGKTRKIDMLFYHIRLKCYVVLELKARAFEPEFAGKLNFYVNAVDELLKTEDDNPTIGLLVCKSKDQTEVQWAFKGIETPMGVATYKNIESSDASRYLPSDEQIRRQVEIAEREFIQGLAEHSTSEAKNPESEA